MPRSVFSMKAEGVDISFRPWAQCLSTLVPFLAVLPHPAWLLPGDRPPSATRWRVVVPSKGAVGINNNNLKKRNNNKARYLSPALKSRPDDSP